MIGGGPVDYRAETLPSSAPGELVEVGTIIHDGREYSAGGASITDARAVVYVGAPVNAHVTYPPRPGEVGYGFYVAGMGYRARGPLRYTATTWDGRAIGELVEVSSWAIPNGWTSGYVHAYQLTLSDGSGRRYAVRGSGPGMVASGRRMKTDAP